MNNLTSENELLQASLAGNKEAFGAVVERYQSLVCAVTYSATGDVGTSEELAQETFVRAWRNLRQLEDPGKFRAWLCTIARNLTNTLHRGSRRIAAHPLERAAGLSATGPGPDEAASAKERQEIVWAAMERVPLQYREPLVLFYRRQQSVSEVAADLGLSEDAVRQRLHRGRQLIKAEVSSLVEDTLTRSGPGKAFAVAVIAALPALGTQTASAAVVGLAAKGAPAAKTLVAASCCGAILGPIIGLIGGILGAWASVRCTNSPRERRFMIRMTILMWLLFLVLVGVPLTLALVGCLPKWAYWSCFAVYLIILFPLIFWSNAHWRRIRIEDGTYPPREYQPRHITRSGVYGSLAGSIFGATLWLLFLAAHARDWVSLGVIVGCDLLLFLSATRFCLRNPRRYWSVALVTVCALLAMMLAAVNLRWRDWMGGYRQSSAYDPRSDISLLTLNLIFLGFFISLVALFATQHIRHKAARKNQVSNDQD